MHSMLPAGAALIGLMDRYLRGLLDPFVSLLEVHKLMYFLQDAGEPLKLRYAKAAFGPYAEDLRHVLRAIEGHLVSGYADGGDTPDMRLELAPGAVEEAFRLLASHEETARRFDRVVDLVDGFESPFGLELLATVHWLARHEGLVQPQEVVAAAYAWNERKKQFTPRQIGIALDVLAAKGWLPEPRIS